VTNRPALPRQGLMPGTKGAGSTYSFRTARGVPMEQSRSVRSRATRVPLLDRYGGSASLMSKGEAGCSLLLARSTASRHLDLASLETGSRVQRRHQADDATFQR
jgi:hypothetical protein